MDAQLLKNITVALNGRTLYPELETSLSLYAQELQIVMQTWKGISKLLPADLEPAPVFASEK